MSSPTSRRIRPLTMALVALAASSTTTTTAYTPAVLSPLFVQHLPRQQSSISSSSSSSSIDSSYVPSSLYTDDSSDQRYSASDWLANIKTLHKSSILKEIKSPVLTITAWSGIMSVIHFLLKQAGMNASRMCMSSKPHSLLVSALGLLLVFRTNSAYQRFAEGRKIWEKLLSVSRNMSRMINLYPAEIHSDRRRRVFRLLSAFPYLLRHHIQPQCLSKTECKLAGTEYAILLDDDDNNNGQCHVDRRSLPWALLPDVALEKCIASANRPLWVCDRLSQELTSVEYTENFTSRERLAFLGHVDKLSHCIGECERIHQTAVPLNYARHSLRSLTMWLVSLPFCLLPEMGLLTAPVMAAISWVLLGVYQIGYTIEDPFQGSLRLSLLCDAVYRDVMYEQEDGSRDSAFELRQEEADEWATMGVPSNNNKKSSPKTTTPTSSILRGVAP